MIRTKNSRINVKDLHPNLRTLLEELSNKFDGIVVTSGKDGVHRLWNSRHYEGKGIDIGANSSNKEAYRKFKEYVLEGRKKWHKPPKFAKYDVEDIVDEGTHTHIELVLNPQELKAEKIRTTSFTVIFIAALGFSLFVYKKVFKK